MKPIILTLRSICALGTVSLFALFLAASQPHRVHHLLENLSPAAGREAGAKDSQHSHAHDHEENSAPLHAHNDPTDAHHDGQPQTDCAIQYTAGNLQLSPNPPFELSYQEITFTRLAHIPALGYTKFDSSPCSQRAPPVR